MRTIGQLSLLVALVGSSYGAFVCLASTCRPRRLLRWAAATCGLTTFISLASAIVILAWALLDRDFHFDYVAHYSSRLLPWHYALSALWAGQAGSLLLWAWMLAALTLIFRWSSREEPASAIHAGAQSVRVQCA
jgi:cytochrome c-type biogenesis protein CcmF